MDDQGHDLTYPYCGSDPAWVNGTTVYMRDEEVPPGGIAVFPVHICERNGYRGPATLRLQYVQEAVDHFQPIFPLRLNFG